MIWVSHSQEYRNEWQGQRQHAYSRCLRVSALPTAQRGAQCTQVACPVGSTSSRWREAMAAPGLKQPRWPGVCRQTANTKRKQQQQLPPQSSQRTAPVCTS